MYAHLVADKDWTPLQSRPEVNLGADFACFHYGGPHLKRDCPNLGQTDNGNDRIPNDRPAGTGTTPGNAGGTSGGSHNRANPPPVNPPTTLVIQEPLQYLVNVMVKPHGNMLLPRMKISLLKSQLS